MSFRLPGIRYLVSWRRHFVQRWLDRRVPPESPRVRLHRRRLFILPTRLGYTFALTLGLLLIGSLNYGTSMGFVVTFLLAGGGTLGMLHTYRNIEGVELAFAPAASVFAGETALFPVQVDARGRPRWALSLVPPAHPPIDFHSPDDRPVALNLPVATVRRGRLRPDRTQLATQWPLGLFRAWSWVYPRIEAVIYPRPLDHGHALPESGPTGQRTRQSAGEDEFSGLRDYRPGDPPRRIAWKVMARTDELQTKAFETTPMGERWLDWDRLEALDSEARLEQLCFWVVELDRAGSRYALKLPGQQLGPGIGHAHRRRCLEALALFGLATEAGS